MREISSDVLSFSSGISTLACSRRSVCETKGDDKRLRSEKTSGVWVGSRTPGAGSIWSRTRLVQSYVLFRVFIAQVTPDVRRDDDMNICEYVKFKKIPGGNKSDCEMISGVVFTKNIANKKMASMLSNPKILVLRCAIDYQVRDMQKEFTINLLTPKSA